MSDLKAVTAAVLRRAQRQGYVLPSEIQAELASTSLPETYWKEVVALSGTALRHREGRYYYKAKPSPRVQEEKRQRRAIHRTVRHLIRAYKKTHAQVERRQQGRIDFVQPVVVQLEDGRQLTLLSRDLSETGIRLIGSRSLLGQKIRVRIPQEAPAPPAEFVVRILWTCMAGDGLFENGGSFLEIVQPAETAPAAPVEEP